MEGEVAQLDKEELACILIRAMSAAKNVGAQRDRLLQLRRRLQLRIPGDEDAARIQEDVASGLHKVYSMGLFHGARYLADCLEMASENRDRFSFSIPAFAVIPDEQLYGLLRRQWHSRRPTTLVQALARIESAYYAVMLPLEHHLPRCIEFLVGVRPPSVTPQTIGVMTGYPDDLIAAANEHLRRLANRPEGKFPNPAAAAGKPPPEESSVDVDLALTYLHRSCSLTSLAVKHLDVAIAFVSSFLDPDEVANISKWTDQRTYYTSEEGPYPPDERNCLNC